ncbi:MAG TPA: RDD family protein [Candidatus Binatus sp.]|nr:RDD family protein [Candidatus Binatus sp.]
MATSAPDPPSSTSGLTFGGYALEEHGLEGVSFWPRAVARVIDFVIHYGVGYFAGMLFRIMLQIAAGGHVPLRIWLKISHLNLPLFVAALLGATAYQVICETVHGSSLGKLMFSMVVVNEDGSPCRLRAAIIREIGYFPDSIFFGIIAYAAMQKSRQQQRYGDQWADTVVCKRSDIAQQNLRGAGRFVLALMIAVMADAAFLMLGLLIQINS